MEGNRKVISFRALCDTKREDFFFVSSFFLHYIIEITEWKFGFISSTLAKFWLKLIEFKTRATCFKCWCGKQLENQCTTLINVAHFTSSFKPYQVDLSRKNTSTVYQQIKSVHLSSFSFEKPKEAKENWERFNLGFKINPPNKFYLYANLNYKIPSVCQLIEYYYYVILLSCSYC